MYPNATRSIEVMNTIGAPTGTDKACKAVEGRKEYLPFSPSNYDRLRTAFRPGKVQRISRPF
jgi:hypothetical protein